MSSGPAQCIYSVLTVCWLTDIIQLNIHSQATGRLHYVLDLT